MRIIHNNENCIGCKACQVACQDLHNFPAEVRLIEITEKECFNSNGLLSVSYVLSVCKQCKKPMCVQSCRVGAINRQDDIVVIDNNRCVGCGSCVKGCPFAAIKLVINQKRKAVKCQCCFSEGTYSPACMAACPLGCISISDK